MFFSPGLSLLDFRRFSGHNEIMSYDRPTGRFSEESLNFKPLRFCEKLQNYKELNTLRLLQMSFPLVSCADMTHACLGEMKVGGGGLLEDDQTT